MAFPKPSVATLGTTGRTANKSLWVWSSVAKDFLGRTRSSKATSRIGKRLPRCLSCLRNEWGFPKVQRSSSTVECPVQRTSQSCEDGSCTISWLLSQKERDVYLAEFEAGDGFEEVIATAVPP